MVWVNWFVEFTMHGQIDILFVIIKVCFYPPM